MTEDPGEPAGADAAGAAPPRTLLERLALGVVALIVAALFGGLGAAAMVGGEVFLGVMGGIGALMTLWAAASNLRHG